MYYVVVNDVIGGWDVSEYDKPASEHDRDESAIAWGLLEEAAKMIALALNQRYGDG